MTNYTSADAIRVRNRMEADAREQIRLIKSELEAYGNYFYPGEKARLKAILRNYETLISSLEA